MHLAGQVAPQLNPKEREWRYLKRDARSHLAASLRDFVDGILCGLRQLQWRRRRHRRRGAPVVPRWPPQAAHGSLTRSPRWRHRLLQASALSPETELTSGYLARYEAAHRASQAGLPATPQHISCGTSRFRRKSVWSGERSHRRRSELAHFQGRSGVASPYPC